MNWIKKSILRKLVVLSVVISLIIFASLGVYVSIRVNTILTENVKEKLVYEADVMSSELNAYFEKNGAVAEQMATDPKVLPFMSSLRTREDKFSHPDFPGFVEEMLAVEATDPNIALSWFGLLKINDLVIDDVTWQHKPDYDMASRPWFLEMKEKGTLTYSTPYIDDITKKLVVSILYPIYDGTEIVGNTAIDLMIDEMSAYISEFKIGDSGYSILITDDGTIVSHPDETKILESNLKDEGGKVAELAGKMISGEQGLDSYVENGKEKYVAYSPIESTGWAVAVVIDRAETIKEVNAFVWSLVLVFFAGVLILVLMIAFVMKKTLKRVPEVKKQIEEFAKGDLSVTIENPGQDEIGQIANSFNEMAGNIKHIVQTVIHSSEQLYNSSEGLVRISDESSKALGEIATTITEIAKGTSSQAKDTENTSVEVKVLSDEIEKVTGNAGSLAENTNEAFQFSSNGEKTMSMLKAHSQDNRRSIQSIKAIVGDMDESSKAITSIVDVINQISSQTNLLALNASIEAARAGDAGKGFAVVADEIRKLAEQTSLATEDIRLQIATIQEKSKHAVEETESSEEIVLKNEDAVKQTEELFSRISELLKTLQHVAEMTKSDGGIMAEKKNEIVSLVENITATSEQVSAGTQQMSAATEEQLASIEMLSEYVKELRDVAKSLQGELKIFKM